MVDDDKSRAEAQRLLIYHQNNRNNCADIILGGVGMSKVKEFQIVIKRINNNKFFVKGQEYDYLQLLMWFKEIITD